MKPCAFGLPALLGLDALTGNIAQAQTISWLKTVNACGAPRIMQPATAGPKAATSMFAQFPATPIYQALADTERKRQAGQDQSTRTQLHQREMFNANARPADRMPGAQNDRTEVQVGEYGAAYCRKTDTGQVSCGSQGYR